MKTLDTLKKPLAITMWDSSWLRRHYRGGGFEDWDKALSELTSRGYNAVRIDAFPHLVAMGPDGKLVEVFKDLPNHSPNFYGFGMWGSQWTNYIKPRKALPEFVKKCREHGVKVALSTWFKPTADGRNEQLEGAESIVRVWDETLRLLETEDCLDTIIYLDFLNELPNGFCMQWYHNMISMRRYPQAEPGTRYNQRQRDFIRSFLNEIIDGLKKKWPAISIAGSIVNGNDHGAIDFSAMDFIDNHIWAQQNPLLTDGTKYDETIARTGHPDHLYKREQLPGNGGYDALKYRLIPQDCDFDIVYEKLMNNWRGKNAELKSWLSERITMTAEIGKKHGIPVGNTEGWGMVCWIEHPLLGWEIHKDAAEFCAQKGTESGYLFNCSSNFCHPFHLGFWEDEEWHRKITDTIKME